MIFKQLFVPKHKHKSPEKRKEAISQVSVVDDSNKQWLHELAFNDADLSVKLAALEKLDQFTMWLKSYEAKGSDVLTSKSKVMASRLLEDKAHVSEALFEDFVKQSRHPEIIKRMLTDSPRLADNKTLYLDTLFKLGNSNDVLRFYREKADEEQQTFIVEKFDDEKDLKRLRKNATGQQVIDIVDNKLSEIAKRARIPQEVAQETTLINSRLLALVDSQDYLYVADQKTMLLGEFEVVKSKFDYLNERQSAEIVEKFLYLKAKVEKRLIDLKPAYEQSIELAETTDLLGELATQLEQINTQVSYLLDADSQNEVNIQSELLSNSLNDAAVNRDKLSLRISEASTGAHRQQLKVLSKQIETNQHQLKSLGELVEKNHSLKLKLAVIAKAWDEFLQGNMSQDALSEEFTFAKKHFAQLDKHSKKLFSEWRALSKNINAHFNELKTQQEKASKRCFAKLNIISRLIVDGKLKAAISTFNHAQSLYQNIERPTRSLQSKYDELAEKVSELKDWQSYVATPKKPELLTQVEDLIADTTLMPPDRANKIKQLRQEWNSLGRLNTDDDDKLNLTFDEQLEKAFLPCREYYAALEVERNQNAENARSIIKDVEVLMQEDDVTVLAKALPALTSKFRKIRILNHSDKNALNKSFNEISSPLYDKLNSFYEDNRARKQKLIDKTTALINEDDIQSAAAQAKQSQADWKNIGFAGKQHDNKLWQDFRDANDAIFNKLSALKKGAADNALAELTTFITQIKDIESVVAQDSSIAQLNDTKMKVQQMMIDTGSLGRKAITDFNAEKSRVVSLIDDRINVINSAGAVESLQNTIDFLKQWTSPENIDNLSELPSKVRNAVEGKVEAYSFYKGLSRDEVFTTLLLLLDTDKAPTNKTLQLKLLAAKLEGQQGLDAKTAWLQWISVGVLQAEDNAQLNTHQALLLANVKAL